VKGKIAEHPTGAEGLVLELIDPAFRNLGGPPSLASCTRDVYAPGTVYTLRAALKIALGIAAAAAHLHTQGIMHGDLYAHNILYTEAGEALLGDFGAACFFDPADLRRAAALQRLEVRAFACLLEDLLTHCPEAAAVPPVYQAWQQLQHRCAQPEVAARPLFAEVVQELASWAVAPA
jgi:serine/threonine protein kinase